MTAQAEDFPATGKLVDFIESFSLADAGADLIASGRLLLIDLFGVALGAATDEIIVPLDAVVGEVGRSGDVTLFGKGVSGDPGAAAFYNGALAHALEFDDSTLNPVGHPSCVIVPAIFALGQARGVTGAALLEAFLVGLEVHSRLGQAHIARWSADDSWLPIGHISVIGAAAACAKLLGLNRCRIEHALGFGAHFSGALSISNGSLAKPLGSGAAARAGVEAAVLAEAGATAATRSIERKGGFADTFFGRGQHDLRAGLCKLGAPHHLEEIGIAIKRYPSCYATHWGVDALLMLLDTHKIGAADIASITLEHPAAGAFCDNPAPRTVEEARFSHEYNLAVAVLDGIPGVESFLPERISRPDIRDMLNRVSTRNHDDSLPEVAKREYRVTVRTVNDDTWSLAVKRPYGHPRNPMDADAVADKFDRCLRAVGRQADAGAIVGLLQQIEAVTSLSQLGDLLAVPVPASMRGGDGVH